MHNIMEKIYLKKDIENIQRKINMLGKTKWDAVGFINLRVFTTILFTPCALSNDINCKTFFSAE